jgi:uncharacterized protein (UPF0297 family)
MEEKKYDRRILKRNQVIFFPPGNSGSVVKSYSLNKIREGGLPMSCDISEKTMMFKVQADDVNQARDILKQVYAALKEKGYNPINQLVGYLLSGDPAYITSHGNARSLIRRLERDELLEELVKNYLKQE